MSCLFDTAAAGDVLAGGFLDPAVTSSFTPSTTVAQPPAEPLRRVGAGRRRRPVRRRLPGPLPAVGADPGGLPGTRRRRVTKSPAKKSAKRQAKIKFTSVPGATFTCAVDGKRAKPCASPFKKRYTLRQAHGGGHRRQQRRHRGPDTGEGEVHDHAGLRSTVRSPVSKTVPVPTPIAVVTAGLVAAALTAGGLGAMPAGAGPASAPRSACAPPRSAASDHRLGQTGGIADGLHDRHRPRRPGPGRDGAGSPSYTAHDSRRADQLHHTWPATGPARCGRSCSAPGPRRDHMLVAARGPKQTVTPVAVQHLPAPAPDHGRPEARPRVTASEHGLRRRGARRRLARPPLRSTPT